MDKVQMTECEFEAFLGLFKNYNDIMVSIVAVVKNDGLLPSLADDDGATLRRLLTNFDAEKPSELIEIVKP